MASRCQQRTEPRRTPMLPPCPLENISIREVDCMRPSRFETCTHVTATITITPASVLNTAMQICADPESPALAEHTSACTICFCPSLVPVTVQQCIQPLAAAYVMSYATVSVFVHTAN